MTELYCQSCGNTGLPTKKTPGSFIGECLFWLFGIALSFAIPIFIIVPIVFSFYRFFSTKRVCSKCESAALIPSDSPNAKKAPVVSDEKLCPFCAETIKSQAIVCKHCGKELTTQSA
ncbi:MAG: hypothetical protein ACAH12_03495 [Methylophilaceae bacterium]